MKIFEQPNVHTTKQRDCRSYTQRCCLGSLVCEAATVGYAVEHCGNVVNFLQKDYLIWPYMICILALDDTNINWEYY